MNKSRYYYDKIKSLPPQIIIMKILAKFTNRAIYFQRRIKDTLFCSYSNSYSSPKKLVTRIELNSLKNINSESYSTILLLTDKYLTHHFDLLGSGWIKVKRNMKSAGFDGFIYQSQAPMYPEQEFIGTANYVTVQKIKNLIDINYEYIDWHIDFKSGFRWEPKVWYKHVKYGDLPGVDVKVPWELSRMQHLVQLSQAYKFASLNIDGFKDPAVYGYEFRNQILDFICSNPPRFGVNWACTMDVAIRVSNWLLAYDLFISCGLKFDKEFELIFKQSVYEHGYHIINNLEWSYELRGNHYLADIAGLLFVSSYLPTDPLTNSWLYLSVSELIKETLSQFNSDGSNFEGSTAYHRLSAEMVIYSAALILGLPAEKKLSLQKFDASLIKLHAPITINEINLHVIPNSDATSPFPIEFWERLVAIPDFTSSMTRPDGLIVQFGDNDSGRFFKISPSIELVENKLMRSRFLNLENYNEFNDDDLYPFEISLDHTHLYESFGTIISLDHLNSKFARNISSYESFVVYLLSGKFNRIKAPIKQEINKYEYFEPFNVTQNEYNIKFSSDGSDLLKTITCYSFPDFGFYAWRSDSLYLAIRCGSLGQNCYGGHSHNDQLSIELWINNKPIIIDPGTYIYTANVSLRNEYRSVKSHFAPQFKSKSEPGSLALGTFMLGNEAQAKCHIFNEKMFIGEHNGYGFKVFRKIILHNDFVEIIDWSDSDIHFDKYTVTNYSTGYGWRYKQNFVSFY